MYIIHKFLKKFTFSIQLDNFLKVLIVLMFLP